MFLTVPCDVLCVPYTSTGIRGIPALFALTYAPAERSEAVDGPGNQAKSAMFVPVAGHNGLYLRKTLAINELQGQRTTVYADGERVLGINFANKEQ